MTTPTTEAGERSRPELPRIVQVGDPVLRAVATRVAPDELVLPEFRSLVATMIAVMRAAPGVGLAAPQIGVPRQVIVVEDRQELIARLDEPARAARERVPVPLTVIVNPTIERAEGAGATFFEGCLSMTGYIALVPRAREVAVRGLDATGDEIVPRVWCARGWFARILQHEVDHLEGTLYVDRMHSRSLCGPSESHRWAGKATAEVARGLGVDLERA